MAETPSRRDESISERFDKINALYRDSAVCKKVHKALLSESWSVDRIVILGLGTNLMQLAQILDIAEIFGGGKQWHEKIKVYVQDPAYDPKDYFYSDLVADFKPFSWNNST